MATLRELNKARRREAILEATLALLREEQLADVTTERIATRAEVSAMTVYNLMGTRDDLLLALVDRVIEGLVATLAERMAGPDRDPVGDARMIVEVSAAAFVADSSAYRQILGSVGDFALSGARMAVDPAQLQVAAMREAQERGIVDGGLDPRVLGRQIYLGYTGAAFAWAGRALDDDGFRVAALHGLYVVLSAAATDPWRERFVDELRDIGAELARARWGRR